MTMIAGAVKGRVIRAEGQLQVFQSYVEQTKRAWSALPAFAVSEMLLDSMIRKFKKEGVSHIDPADAREVAVGLRNISERIRIIDAKADLVGATQHLPWRFCMPRLRARGQVLGKIARDVFDYEQQWRHTVDKAAAGNLEAAKNTTFCGNLDVDWSEAAQHDTPEDELASHNCHIAMSSASPEK